MKHAMRDWRRHGDASPTQRSVGALVTDTRGLASVEYIVLFVTISVGTLAMWIYFGGALAGLFVDDTPTRDNPSATRNASVGGASSGPSQSMAASSLPRLGGIRNVWLGAKDGDSNKSASFLSRTWDATKAAVGETVDLVAGGVVGVVPFGSTTNPTPPFGNQREFGQGMMVTSGAMMVAEAGAMLGDGAVTVASGGTASAVTVPAAVGIAAAAAGSVINWQNGARLVQSAGTTSSGVSGTSGASSGDGNAASPSSSGETSGVSGGAADNTSPAGVTKRPKGFRKKTVQDA